MILYGAALSPYVRKVHSYILERGLEAEVKAVGIGDADPGFLRCSPLGKMPALADGDFGIADSSAIITYLEAMHAGSGLVPDSAQGKAQVHWFDKFADAELGAAGGKMFFNRIVAPKLMGREGNAALADEGEASLAKYYAYLEGAVGASGWLVGDAFSLADISVATVLGNIRLLGHGPDAGTYPKLHGWMEAAYARPGIAAPYAHAEKNFARIAG